MSLQIGKAIYELLHSNTAVEAKVQDKVYPLVADKSTTFPFIVYKRTEIIPAYTKDRFSANEYVTVEVIVASDNYIETVEIADLVRLALEGKQGTFANI
nr:DUF3168 domain-containing protein [uncultured Bacteroides sp.]